MVVRQNLRGAESASLLYQKRHHLRKKALRAVRAPGLRAIKKTFDPEDDDSDRVADVRNSSENITAVWWLLLDMNFAQCEDALSFCSFWFERAARCAIMLPMFVLLYPLYKAGLQASKDGLRFGFPACLPSFSRASSGDEVRLSYHGNQAFNEGASCTARSNSPPTEPSARRLARRNSTSRTHHVDSTEEAQGTRKNRR